MFLTLQKDVEMVVQKKGLNKQTSVIQNGPVQVKREWKLEDYCKPSFDIPFVRLFTHILVNSSEHAANTF